MAFNQFPYSNFHDLNLDWILQKIKNLDSELKNFVDLNTLKWADPVEWNITTPYRENLMVVYNNVGYLSRQPVPAGVPITNTDYWVAVLDVSKAVVGLYTEPGSNLITVAKTGGMFTTINDAINAAKKYCSPSNRVAIAIFQGTYNEEINLLGNPGIDMVGIGDVTVQYASVYPNSPLHTTGAGHFSNIFFHALNSTKPSYALHIEAQEDNTAGKIAIDNCMFSSDAQSGIGIGLGTGFEVVLQHCTAVSSVSAGLYCHNNPAPASNQTITLKDCVFNGTSDIFVDDARLLAGGSIGESYFNVNVFGGVGYTGKVRLKVAENTVYNYFADGVSNLVVGKFNICRGFPGADYYLRNIGYTTDAYFTNGACAIPAPDSFPRNYSVTAINPKTEANIPVTVTPVGQTLNVIASGFSDGSLRITVTGTINT